VGGLLIGGIDLPVWICFRMMSNIGLFTFVCVSQSFTDSVCSVYKYNSVPMCLTLVLFHMQYFHRMPYECPVLFMCCENLELRFSVLIMAWICFLNLSLNVRPVCRTYLSGHSPRFKWYMPLRLCISSVLSRDFKWSWIVLFVLTAIFTLVCLNNLVIVVMSGPK
jgi:hypothetical protein